MERVLITGAKGMLGLELTDVFGDSYDVYGRDIDDFDITRDEETVDAIIKIRPDVVIHTAAYTDVDGCESHIELAHSVNGGGTKNVASACRELGSEMVYISTDYVFDGTKSGAYSEEDSTCPINTYGRSKLEGERWVRTMVGQFVIVRTAWLFGRGGDHFVKTILKLAREKGALSVVTDQVGSPTYAVDLSRAIYILMEKKCRGIYHITNGKTCSWYEYAQEILAMSGLDNVSVDQISSDQLDRAAKRPRNSVLDRGKFERETGYRMRPWREALRDYLEREAKR
ncbi:MAG: dTDP-4-dehydrorhamnose reductase [Syntrophobacterales bacterium]|nr:MAG: dTDP-4-dehydrorhamnose reductase [Syntrophobacterales bacterium]